MITNIPLQQLQRQFTGKPILLGEMGWRWSYPQVPQGCSHGPRTPDDYRKDTVTDSLLWRYGDYTDGTHTPATIFIPFRVTDR